MTTSVVTLPPDMPVKQAARVLLERRISAAPVVDAAGRLVGIVSENDLVRRTESETARPESWWLRLIAHPEEYTEGYVLPGGRVASDVMTRNVHSVDEDMSLHQIAELLEQKRIKRVPVLRGDRVVGIVSRANLLHALATRSAEASVEDEPRAAQAAPTALRDEPRAGTRIERSASKAARTVREDIMAAVGQEARNDVFVNVIVSNGTVHLWGLVDSEADKEAVRQAAEQAAGGRAVDDHLGITPPYLRSMSWT
jgi:CBS domain-containing protein